MGWLRAVGFLLVLIGFGPSATGTEPPCNYPSCFPGGEPSSVRVFSAGKARLEVFSLGKFGPGIAALYRVTEAEGKTGPFISTFIVPAQDKQTYVFEQYPKALDTSVRLNAALDVAMTAVLNDRGVLGPQVMTYDEPATRRTKLRAIAKALREQRALEEYDSYLYIAREQLDAELGKLNQQHGLKLTGTIHGGEPKAKELARVEFSDMPYRCLDVIGAIEAFCERGGTAQVQLGLTALECHFSTKPRSSAALKSGVLAVQLSLTQPRDGAKSFNALAFLEKKLLAKK